MIEIEKPNINTAFMSEDGAEGEFFVEPLERGYGTTLGKSLRRIFCAGIFVYFPLSRRLHLRQAYGSFPFRNSSALFPR